MQNLALSTIGFRHIDEISSSKNEPDWLKEYRKNSLSVYQKLPLETSPLYNKYTDANKMDPEQVSLTINSDKSVPEFLTNRLNELANETCIVQIGSNIHKINLPDELQKKGLVISSIDDALKNYTDIIQKTLESTNSKEDKYTALNNAAFNSGIFIYVPRNLILEKPIHIVSSLSVDGVSTISRNVIVTEDNSKASIVQELYAPKTSHQQAYLELLNVSVGQNSQLDGTTLQIMDNSAVNFSTRKSNIAQDGKINWYLGLFGAMLSRYRIDYYLNGSGASANDSEVVFGNDNQSFDLSSNVNHEKPSTEAKVIEKSVSIPGLEIFTNDVKATHSASIAQIDEEQIFYLQTRCLTREEAERIIVEGFLEPLSRTMSYQVRAWISYLIESKWEGRDMSIKNDEQLKALVEVEETRYNENAEIEQHYKYR